MTPSEPRSTGCSSVPLPVLVQLREAIEQGRLDCPPTETGLHAAGFGALGGVIAGALAGLEGPAAAGALRLVIAERVHRPPPRLSLVWTGPEPRASVSRDTARVVRDLFASAQRSVLVAGYAFDRPEILEPLHAAMVARGVKAVLLMDIPGSATSAEGAEALATAAVDDFFRAVWTFGAPRPDVYHDPRTPLLGPPWASLHAKCIVVDDERALVTSANFTDRGQTRNLEAGVLIEDHGFAEELGAQWRALVTAGLLRRYDG